jgi:hypothetical protein
MAGRKRIAPSLTRIQSAITNGRRILADVDHRSAPMRRLRDLIVLHTADLGGADFVSEAEQRLIRRAAMLTIQLEMMDCRFALNEGEANRVDLETYQRCSNSLRRLLESLGLQRRQRDVATPTIDQYLARSKQIEMERAG